MNVGFIMGSVSRKGAGLFESARALGGAIASMGTIRVNVFGLRDEYTDADIPRWHPLLPATFATVGPHRFGFAPKLSAAMDAARLDMIHSHGLWIYPSYASYRWSRLSRRPTVVSLHGMLDSEALRISRQRKRLARWLFEDDHLKTADCLHALSHYEAASIRQFGLRNPICIIPNGIELPSAPESATLRPSGAPKTLLYLGRLHPIKNLVGLLHAWHHLRKRSPALCRDWRLVLAGWSQQGHGEHLAQLCTSYGMSDSVSFVGPQYGVEKARMYREADAFVLPSTNEALPMVVLEAWSYGLPVAMTAACHLPIGYETGAAQAIGMDPDTMSHGLQALLEMADRERIAMGAKGRQLVHDRFVWSKIAADMSGVYQWLIDGGAPPSCIVLN